MIGGQWNEASPSSGVWANRKRKALPEVKTDRIGSEHDARSANFSQSGNVDPLSPLAAAGLDVFEDEPRVNPALLARENAVLAPHIGSAERPTRVAMASTAAVNVMLVLRGEPPLTPVTRR